jgi:hypothetical protein
MPKKIAVNGSDLYYFNNVEESKKFINRFEKIKYENNCADEFLSIVEEKVNQCEDLLKYLSSIVNREGNWVLLTISNLCKKHNIPFYVEDNKYSILYQGNYYTAIANSDFIGFLSNADWKAINRAVKPATKIYE